MSTNCVQFVYQEKKVFSLLYVRVLISEKVLSIGYSRRNPPSGTWHGQSANTLVNRLFQKHMKKIKKFSFPINLLGPNIVVSYSRPLIRHLDVVCSSCFTSLVDMTALHFILDSVINVKSRPRELKRDCTAAEIQYEILN